MSRTKSTKKTRRPAPKKSIMGFERVSPPMSAVLPLTILPDRLRTHLVYHEISQNMVSGASKFANNRIQNSLTLTNPAGGTNVIGAAGWATFYGQYRVNKLRLRLKVVNQETFPLNFYILPLIADPGVNFANLQTAAQANPRAIVRYLGASAGQSRASIRSPWYSLPEIVGFPGTMSDKTYTAATGAAPANVFYVAYGIDSNTNVMVSGVGYELDVDLDVEYWGRNFLTG